MIELPPSTCQIERTEYGSEANSHMPVFACYEMRSSTLEASITSAITP